MNIYVNIELFICGMPSMSRVLQDSPSEVSTIG